MIELRKLNFEKLISVSVPDITTYTYDEYKKHGYEHTPINGYCTSCEEKGCNISKDDDSYKLTNISHGAHSSDFFRALKVMPDTSAWHHDPILFVYETPSLDYRIYKDVIYKEYKKRPSKDWYWIHKDQEDIAYPERFRGREYGGFVLSAIQTFKLANVYMTNLVKCGLNNEKGKFKGLSSYRDETITNCFSKFLEKEISILKPKVIFAMGSAVEKKVKEFVKETYYVQQLPHPAGRRRGFRDEHYKAIYFWGLTRALHKVGIINTDEGCELARLYLDKYDEKQFVEYSKRNGEFEYMNEISSTDIDYYCRNFSDLSDLQSDGIFRKIKKLIERLAEDDIDFAQYGLKDVNPERRKYYTWGRKGLDFSFNTKNNYVRWFFYGIYYNTKDHGIPFIKTKEYPEGVPELAFFFDINPKYRERLSQNGDFKRALGNLEKLGFEENLIEPITDNKWRLLFKRVPLTKLGSFSYQDVKKHFEKILSQLKNEDAFYQEMMAPPE